MTLQQAMYSLIEDIRKIFWSSKNIEDIVREYSRATTIETIEGHRWKDLLIRSKWCVSYLGRQVDGPIYNGLTNLGVRAHFMAWGEKYVDMTPVRIMTPLSFSTEPCAECKALENSFYPNDMDFRDDSIDWKTRYAEGLNALIANSYKMMSAGRYWYNIICEDREALEGTVSDNGYNWTDIFKLMDTGMSHSKHFLDNGRLCFSQTERTTKELLDGTPLSNKEIQGVEIDFKYNQPEQGALITDGGLWNVNEDLLCFNCQANVETSPVTVTL